MSSKSAKKSEQRRSNQQQDGAQASQSEQIQSPQSVTQPVSGGQSSVHCRIYTPAPNQHQHPISPKPRGISAGRLLFLQQPEPAAMPGPTPLHGGPDAQGAPEHDLSTNANACGPCPLAVRALERADARRYPDPTYTRLRALLGQ